LNDFEWIQNGGVIIPVVAFPEEGASKTTSDQQNKTTSDGEGNLLLQISIVFLMLKFR